MKPFIIFALWAFVGWDVGAWAEAYVGIPSVVGILAGIAIGAALAVRARRRIAAVAANGVSQVPAAASSFEATTFDRAA